MIKLPTIASETLAMPGNGLQPPGQPATGIKVSIIVVSYNSLPYLERCLTSLQDSIGPEVEIILVDNASSDGTAEFVVQAFPRVHLHQAASNRGYAAGNNLGAGLAKGKYLLFLNPDTQITAGWLDPLAAALEADPGCGLATPKILLMSDPGKINTCGSDIHISGLTLCRGLRREAAELGRTCRVAAVSGAAFIMRRDLFLALGGFDDAFFMYMEDTDLSWRARLSGFHCLYVPESNIYHDYRLNLSPRKTFFQERNRYLMLLKSLRWPTLLLLLPVWLLAELVTWGFVLLYDRTHIGNKVHAYRWVWRHRAQIAAKRRAVQAIRRATDRELLSLTTHVLAYEQAGLAGLAQAAHWLFDIHFAFLRGAALFLLQW